MTLYLNTAPTSEPVTLAEAKLHARVDNTEENDLIEALIEAARREAENLMHRQIMPATYELILDSFPCGDYIELPMAAPLTSVTSVAYTDTSGSSQTLTAVTDYVVDTKSEPGRIFLPDGKTWPSTQSQRNVVTITYVCGYTSAPLVPESIKTWIKMAVSTLYDNREQLISGSIIAKLPRDYLMGLLDPYTIPQFA